jgi:hypothetical protein
MYRRASYFPFFSPISTRPRMGSRVSLECPVVCGSRATPFQRELSPSKLRPREVVAVFDPQANIAFFDRSFCLPPSRTLRRGISVRPSPLVQAQRGGRARRVGPIPDRADRPEVAARAQLFQPKPRPGRRPSARRPMSRCHSCVAVSAIVPGLRSTDLRLNIWSAWANMNQTQ